MDKHVQLTLDLRGIAAAPMTPQLFGNAGLEHMEKYGMFSMFIKISMCMLGPFNYLALTSVQNALSCWLKN